MSGWKCNDQVGYRSNLAMQLQLTIMFSTGNASTLMFSTGLRVSYLALENMYAHTIGRLYLARLYFVSSGYDSAGSMTYVHYVGCDL